MVNLDDPRSILLPTTCAGQDERASSPSLLLQTGEPPGVISAFNVTALPRPSWTGSIHVDQLSQASVTRYTALLGEHHHMARTAPDAPIPEGPFPLYLLAMYR